MFIYNFIAYSDNACLTLLSMGYFENTTVWRAPLYGPPNFVVPSSIMIKCGVLIEFDKFSPK